MDHDQIMKSVELLQAMPVRSRFDGPALARSGFNVFATALGLPAEVAWEQTNQSLWETCAGSVITIVEQAALTMKDVSFDDLATLIASWMGSNYGTGPFEERVAWRAIAVLWANAIKSHDLDLLSIEQDACAYARRKIDDAKPKPAPEPKTNGTFLSEAIQQLEQAPGRQKAALNEEMLNNRPLPKSTSGLHEIIDLKIADYQQKLAALQNLRKTLTGEQSAALWEIMNDVLRGE